MEEELRFHLRMRMEEKLAQGLTPAEARRQATREFGNLHVIKDAWRDIGGAGALESFCQDVRFAFRALPRERSFTAAAVLALVLGIGANTALFTILSSVLLRPLPFEKPEELMAIWSRESARPDLRAPVSFPDFEDFRRENRWFEHLGGYRAHSFVVSAPERPGVQADGAYVTADIFPLLRVQPELGRTFSRAEEERGGRAVVISDNFVDRALPTFA